VIAAILLAAGIAFVPLDDRPVTLQLPQMLGAIAGERIDTPPRAMLGRYLEAGKPDDIIAWLNAPAQPRDAYVVSTDMLAYGGLIASRVPGPSYADAVARLRELAHLRQRHANAWIAAFATIVRLAPTGVPANSGFFAAYPAWTYLQQYANLHDPPLPQEEAQAARLRAQIGEPLLDEYLGVRARNAAVDASLVRMTAQGAIDRLAIGQDDAGPVGLHVKDVRGLEAAVAASGAGDRASIEPGADELGMALVAHALARSAAWTPRVAVLYSMPDGAAVQDPLEFAPIASAIDSLIRLCGGVRVDDDGAPDIVLAVRVPGTTPEANAAFLRSIEASIAQKHSVALADLSFLESYAAQGKFASQLLDSKIASDLDAYASWNTNANTVGTALSEAIAAGAGRRRGTYDGLAHRTFTFMRFVDDYAFHVDVRPGLNAELESRGIDRTLLDPSVAAPIAERNRALLWNDAASILVRLYPGYHIAALQIELPWSRTFETKVNVGIAPDL
jgi:Protein of unknown function (DUF4127)